MDKEPRRGRVRRSEHTHLLQECQEYDWYIERYSRVEVLMVACSLFREHGYHGTTIREIARLLDIREASLFTCFGSKEGLLWEIIDRLANLFLTQARMINATTSCEEQLRQLIYGHLEVMVQEHLSLLVASSEERFLPQALCSGIKAKRHAYEQIFLRVLAEGWQQGIFLVPNVQMAYLFLVTSLDGLLQHLDYWSSTPFEQLATYYQQMILGVLKGSSSLSEISVTRLRSRRGKNISE